MNPSPLCVCRLLLLLVVGIVLLNVPCEAASLFAGLTGTTNGVTFSEANGVDASGNAVVGRLVVDGDFKAFRWTTSAGLQTIDGTRQGWGISGDGQVIVGDAINPVTKVGEPFRWSNTDGLQLLDVPLGRPIGPIPPYVFVNGARRVSHDGSVIVGQAGIAPETRAFRWTSASGVVLLDSTTDQFQLDSATAVSDDGQVVVGGALLGPNSYVPYRWTAETGTMLIGNFPQVDVGYAFGVSADGSVVVGASGAQAFRWTAATGLTALSSSGLPGPYRIAPFFSQAFSASRTGEAIVGMSSAPYPYDVPGDSQAFVWTEAFGMESLHLVLENRFGLGLELEGWRLSEARAISADGRAIVGVGVNPDGNTEAWLVRLDRPLSVPEPATLAMFLVGGSMISITHQRHRSSV